MTDLRIYQLGVALGSERVEAADLVEQYGPVREGFLDRKGFANLYRVGQNETGLNLAVDAIEAVEKQYLGRDGE